MDHQIPELIAQVARQLLPRYQEADLCTNYAWWMIEAITEQKKAQLLAKKTLNLDAAHEKKLNDWIYRQVKFHEPLAYILGTVPFLDLNLTIKPPILIPRPETEEWVAKLLEQLKSLKNKKLTILDIGTGSGCIALALAKALPQATIFGVDINSKALALAQENARKNNISNVIFVLSNLFADLPQTLTFDLIISNPPYLSSEELKSVDASVAIWEDINALVAQDNGLALIKNIIDQAKHHISDNKELEELGFSNLWIEIGFAQGKKVVELMCDAGVNNICVEKDLQGKDRVVKGQVAYVAKPESTKKSTHAHIDANAAHVRGNK